jgi:Holliday junction resolvasome RuvABC endonuclease subunit
VLSEYRLRALLSNKQFESFVLAIYPSSRGFAFVVFEGPESPFDWGAKEFRGSDKNARSLNAIRELIERYRPDAIVIEDFTEDDARRSPRIRRLYRSIVALAQTECIDLFRYSKTQVRHSFGAAGVTTKHDIATAIARHIPAFGHRLPRFRKIWMSEDGRQNLFDAAALGLTHYVVNRSLLA